MLAQFDIPMQPLTQRRRRSPRAADTKGLSRPRCAGTLYQDDGTTLDYQKGEYLRLKFSASQAPKDCEFIGSARGNYRPCGRVTKLQIFGWTSGKPRVFEW